MWVFKSASNSSASTASESPVAEPPNRVEVQGIGLSLRDKGVYESANLARGKSAITNLGTPTPTSSPSASFENNGRNAYFGNTKAIHNNSQSSAHEQTSASPVPRSGMSQENHLMAGKDIHSLFISAVLSSISYFLCRDYGYIPLNARTFMTRANLKADSAVVLATVDVSLTPLGTLVLKAYAEKASGIECPQTISESSRPPVIGTPGLTEGSALWLGPSGIPARFHSSFDETDIQGRATQLSNQLSSEESHLYGLDFPAISAWQAECMEWLSTRGLDITELKRKGWVMVQILKRDSPQFIRHYGGVQTAEDLATIPWPALLCFHISSTETPNLIRRRKSASIRNPISFAEEWFAGQDSRASNKLKRQKDKQASEALSKERNDGEYRTQTATGQSPSAIRRSSNAGAVYPTPPDGVNHPVGATPSFDGTVSSPGNVNQIFNNDSDTIAPSNPGMTGADTGNWTSSETKDKMNSTMNFNDEEDDDNLFGDMEGDLFADTAITDADFNFFDEPGDTSIRQASGSPGADMDASLHEQDTTDKKTPQHSTNIEREQQDMLMRDINDPPKQDLYRDQLSSKEVPGETQKERDAGEPDSTARATLAPPGRPASPPFNMTTVFQQIFPASGKGDRSQGSTATGRRASNFNKVEFEAPLNSVNEKYELHGRFDFSEKKNGQAPVDFSDLPRTDYLSRHRRAIDERSREALEVLAVKDVSANIDDGDIEDAEPTQDSEVSSLVSDQDDMSYTADAKSLRLRPGIKRKRNGEDEERDDITSSLSALMVDFEQSSDSPTSLSGHGAHLLAPDSGDWPLGGYFSIPCPESQYAMLSDTDYVATAQIIADQAVSGTFKVPEVREHQMNSSCTDISAGRDLAHCLVQTAKSCLGRVTVCNMTSYLEIQGMSPLPQGIRLPPRPLPVARAVQNSDNVRSRSLFSLPSPQLEVLRSDSKLTILPSAVNFWETLGLSPSEGGKDVEALCVYPNLDGVVDAASSFLDEMRSVYEAYKLGTHDRINSNDTNGALLSFDTESSHRPVESLSHGDLKETTMRISRILSSLSAEGSSRKNLVVYFVYPVHNTVLLTHICASFKLLFDFYRKALTEKKLTASNELVLQLIPLDLIASPTYVKVPSPAEYVRLAMQVYDRCINFSSSSSPPAILLDQPLPKGIDFKLSPNPSASVLQENTCLHVAYAQSIDDRWITAAWTDNRGNRQMTSSYCLGRRNEPLSRTFSEIASEIWQTTLDTTSQKRINWRVMIVKVGTMDQTEIDCWVGLAAAASDSQITLTLITAKTEPSLRLLPTPGTLQPPTHIAQAAATPVSTPQPTSMAIVSPENPMTVDALSTAENALASESLAVHSEAGTNGQPSTTSVDGGGTAQASGTPTGPMATLQNAMASPENIGTPARDTPGNAPTPAVESPANPGTPGDISSEPDIDARIIDCTDECWGAILSHRLNNSNSLLELNLALMSGYMIKRGGMSSDDPPVLLEVNIVHSDIVGNTRAFYEGMLKEIIWYYRGLATLAKARGVIDPVRDGRPWHVAAAEKAVKALYMLL